jgi:hypothetical protein
MSHDQMAADYWRLYLRSVWRYRDEPALRAFIRSRIAAIRWLERGAA